MIVQLIEQPSKRAYDAVRKLAREAARNDHWMVPELDGLDGADDISTAHRESWQQTCHWEHYYGTAISRIVDQQERRFCAPGESLDCEARYFRLYEPLLDAFWEEWEEKSGFWDAVNKKTA